MTLWPSSDMCIEIFSCPSEWGDACHNPFAPSVYRVSRKSLHSYKALPKEYFVILI